MLSAAHMCTVANIAGERPLGSSLGMGLLNSLTMLVPLPLVNL